MVRAVRGASANGSTRRLRRVVFWLHLTAGSIAGLVIGTMAATGVLIAFEPQLLAAFDGSVRRVPAPAADEILPAGSLLERVREARPKDALRDLTVYSDPARAASVSLGRDRVLFLDPRDGGIRGEGSRRARAFCRTVTGVHRWLGAGEEKRPLAKAVTGACNAAFFALAITGLYLWWPREWTRRALARIGWFQRGLAPKARHWNWHNTIGFWCAPVLIVLTASGLVISYPWASDLVYRAAGEKPPPRREAPAARPAVPRSAGGRAQAEADAPAWPETAALDGMWERAAAQSAGWQTLILRPPRKAGDSLAVTIREAGARSYQRSTLTLNSATGEVEKWEPFAAATTGRRARVLLRFLHTGEALGLPGQAVAGIASLGATLLVFTGLSLALRRFANWLRTRFRAGERGGVRPLVETPEDAG